VGVKAVAGEDTRDGAILSAALRLITLSGPEAVTMSALAQETGLSRPAIYQYFSSSHHVLGELLVNEMADLSNQLDRLVSSFADPMEQVRSWVHYCLAYLSNGDHHAIQNIAIHSLPPEYIGELKAMHGFFMSTLLGPLEALGVAEPNSLCGLIYGSVSAAGKRIAEGSDFVREAKMLEVFIEAGIGSALSGGLPGKVAIPDHRAEAPVES
jgi:AcrR family transcriptional regulator